MVEFDPKDIKPMLSVSENKFQVPRIKKIMQKNKEIGKIANQTPHFIAHALELFIKDITANSVQIQQQYDRPKIEPAHIKKAVETVPHFKFLSALVKNEPDIDESEKALPDRGVKGADDEEFTRKETRHKLKAKNKHSTVSAPDGPSASAKRSTRKRRAGGYAEDDDELIEVSSD